MLGILLTSLVTALSLLVVDILLPGVNLSTFAAALVGAIAIGVVNGSIRPLLRLLSLPLTLLSFGLFSLVVNGFCFWLAAVFVPGFSVQGPLSFFLGPIILSIVSTFLGQYMVERIPSLQSKES